MIAMTNGSEASPLDEFHWKSRVLVVVAPAGDTAAEAQRRIYRSSARGMSERSIVLTEALDESERSRQIRRLSADGRRFQVFLVGKDGQPSQEAILIRLVKMIEPNTWEEHGGAGAVDYFPLGNSLVVRQSDEVHEKVEKFLQELRGTVAKPAK